MRKASNADAYSPAPASNGASNGHRAEDQLLAEAGTSEEDRSLAEAIRLSMLDDLTAEAAATGAEDAANTVDALASRLAAHTLASSSDAPPAPPPAPASADPAAAEAALADAASEDHLPAGWESALTDEPPKGAAGSTRVQLRLASGKTAVRRFWLTDSVAALFAACVALVPDARHTPFALQTPIASAVYKHAGARARASGLVKTQGRFPVALFAGVYSQATSRTPPLVALQLGLAQVKLLDVANDPVSAHDLANAKVLMSWT